MLVDVDQMTEKEMTAAPGTGVDLRPETTGEDTGTDALVRMTRLIMKREHGVEHAAGVPPAMLTSVVTGESGIGIFTGDRSRVFQRIFWKWHSDIRERCNTALGQRVQEGVQTFSYSRNGGWMHSAAHREGHTNFTWRVAADTIPPNM